MFGVEEMNKVDFFEDEQNWRFEGLSPWWRHVGAGEKGGTGTVNISDEVVRRNEL